MEQAMAGNQLAARMELCRKCQVLRGPFFDWHNRCPRVQRCACEPPEALWNAFDYNRAAELCRCCAARVIGCGSKWSVFFCDGCKRDVVAYNGAAECTVTPVCRTSFGRGATHRCSATSPRASGAPMPDAQDMRRRGRKPATP
jgi:hypothetical protein